MESEVKQKSLKLNMFLNALRGMLSVIFPLITFPYVSRVLGVEEIGRYNFANSLISYFVLIAGLGISSYAIREGARFRNDKVRFNNFTNEIFSINILSTCIAYLLLVIAMITVPKLWNYKALIIIISLQIIFTTIGIEWIYSIYEDYAYITVRSIVFKLISIALLFLLVRDENDVNTYAATTVFSGVGSNILNYIHARKYCKIRLTKKIDWKRHMKPVLVLFAMAVTVTIYVSSDTTILGFLCSYYEVGLYSVSVKIYNIIKSVVSSIVLVSIPRMAAILGKGDKKDFSIVGIDIYNTLLTAMLPAMIGIIILREQIVLIVSGNEYIGAVPSLAILSVALVMCLGAYFWGQAVLVPAKMENVVLVATIISAVINIGLNFALIPIWKERAAAFTTFLAEGIAFLICRYEGKKIIKMKGVGKALLKIIIGCTGIVGVSFAFRWLKDYMVLYTVLTITCSIIVYIVIEIILKNESIISVWNKIRLKIGVKKGEKCIGKIDTDEF